MSSSDSTRRRRGHDHDEHRDAAKRPRRGQKKHIYLVVEDWEMGYSIHKLDIDDLDSGEQQLGRLPERCAIRIQAPVDRDTATVAAFGSKIFFVTDRSRSDDEAQAAPLLIYDTETASLAIGPRLAPELVRPHGFILFVSVGQRVYAFNPRRRDQQLSFDVISRGPRDEDGYRLSRRAERWSVESAPAPNPLGKHEIITAYAVHPDERTIFVSARRLWDGLIGEVEGGTTQSFDTGSSVWTSHGEWQLPFLGQGHYVHELDAWVGLRKDGILCSCAVPSRRGTTERTPDWKLGRKTLFREDPERHVMQRPEVSLIYMGDARFCLVECAARKGDGWEDTSPGDVDGCVLHVTIFSVRYDKRGDLQTTPHHARSYLYTMYGHNAFAAQAFWM